ncbi:MAG: peptidase S41 [Clostridium sp.]
MSNTWEEKWIEDINYLRDTLIKNHKNLFFNISKDEFEEKIKNLKSMINELDYEEMKVEISRVIASIKDAHTAIAIPAKRYLPFKLYWFNDGIYIINTTAVYKKILYKKVTAIDGIPINEVIDDMSQIISYENDFLFKAQCVKYMQVAEVLYGLLIIDSMESLKVRVEDKDIEINTVSFNELQYIVNDKLPIYAKKSDENLWYEYIEKEQDLYIKYNSCREYGEILIKDKIIDITKFIENNKIHKVIVDLRNNMGGDSTLLEPLIDYIKKHKVINTKGNLKVVIGRETFSSALLNAYKFKFETNATIIGEPSGGKPNCYGEILRFNLPNSKFNISYSTRYYKIIEDDSVMALYPDELMEESIEDFIF